MTCNNLGDEDLERTLIAVEVTSLIELADQVIAEVVQAVSTDVVGDIGEKALAMILKAEGHEVIQLSDKHTPRPGHQLPNDMVTVSPDGRLLTHDSKAGRSGKTVSRPNPDGIRNLAKPQLSKDKAGIRQLSDAYNRTRIEQVITFETGYKDGEGPQSLVTKVDLTLMQYQTWEVDANGRIGDPIHTPRDASVEITAALVEVMEERDLPWPQ